MSNIIIIYKFDNFFFISVVCTAESDFSRLNYSNNSAVEFIRKRFRVRFLSHGQTDDTLDNIIRTRVQRYDTTRYDIIHLILYRVFQHADLPPSSLYNNEFIQILGFITSKYILKYRNIL